MASHFAWAGEPPPRIWILPFDNPRGDASSAYLAEAIPALLAVAISQSDQHAVVDRRHLDQVLSERSLTLEGLTAEHARREVGRLLGATLMIGGSFMKREQHLLITMRAVDIETGMVSATAEARGPAGQIGRLVSELFRRLARDLGTALPDLRADQIDEAPLSNLHFMRGLGYYFSARYNQALAEFLQAAREERLSDVSRMWLANSYLAQGQYGHAYLELSRLTRGGSGSSRKGEIEAKMRACVEQLSAEEVRLIGELARPKTSAKE